jgi:hypothetical protein
MKVPNLGQGEISHGTGRHATAGSEREIGDTAHPTRPTDSRRQAWSCSCHFVWICGSPTRLCSGDAAGSAEAQPHAAGDLPVRQGRRGVRREGARQLLGSLGRIVSNRQAETMGRSLRSEKGTLWSRGGAWAWVRMFYS